MSSSFRIRRLTQQYIGDAMFLSCRLPKEEIDKEVDELEKMHAEDGSDVNS